MTTDTLVKDADLTLPRLYALRFGYSLLAFGLAFETWPVIVAHDSSWRGTESLVYCILAGLSLMAFVGLRHPVAMLPLLLFESAWKLIWLGAVALPAWLSGSMDDETWGYTASCLLVVIFLAVVPWPYAFRRYLHTPAERWR
ncbi:hypothetical protein Val02_30290 [Virgisporangium aliadipatigenens]|uniref:Uncharacterized protein n=1 Tax=Virgisporangium aliadipatigenens TaxID=741659 RepID=A0A8J3YL64_9ACTN|nr:hypothetical protein [Virgisporangium aliadipatigenens]GIJ46143.1 hypothetical protein Val02_30290 [Virgisporangium aliadipatigenens]